MNLRNQQNDLRQEEVRIFQQINTLRLQTGQNQLNNVQAQQQGQLHTWKTQTTDFQPIDFQKRYVGVFAGPTLSSAPQKPKPQPKLKLNPADSPKILREAYKNLLVAKVQLDSQKRVLITTKPITITKGDKKLKVGKYQIQINFTQSFFSNAIRIMNIERTIGGYDHPHIHGYVCWGTMARDLEKDYNNRDFLEIVTDCIDFVSSPFDTDSMISGGWQTLIDDGEKRKRSYLTKGEKVITIKK